MPSDIGRHRKSKQHQEVTITTVQSTSKEGIALLERMKSQTTSQSKESSRKRKSADSDKGLSPSKKGKLDNKKGYPSEDNRDSLAASKDNQAPIKETVDSDLDVEIKNDNSESELHVQNRIECYLSQPSVSTTTTCEGNTTSDLMIEEQLSAQKVTEDIGLSTDSTERFPSSKSIAKEVASLMKEMKISDDTNEQAESELLGDQIPSNLDEWNPKHHRTG